MNSMWTKEKSRLSAETMKAMRIVRQNNDMECDKFYHKVSKKCEYAAKDCFIRKILIDGMINSRNFILKHFWFIFPI